VVFILSVVTVFVTYIGATGYRLSRTAAQSSSSASAQSAKLAQEREWVIPQQVIDGFKMEPLRDNGPWVLGQDGKPYSTDDALRVLFLLAQPHWSIGPVQRNFDFPKTKK